MKTGVPGVKLGFLATNQNSLLRSRDWLSANQAPVFPNSVGSWPPYLDHQWGHHDNIGNILLVYHSPEGSRGVRFGSLGGYKLVPLMVTLIGGGKDQGGRKGDVF